MKLIKTADFCGAQHDCLAFRQGCQLYWHISDREVLAHKCRLRSLPNEKQPFARRSTVIKLSAAVAAILLVAGPAMAIDELSPASKPTIRVATADLDLSQPSGQAAMRARINKAIKAACYPNEAFHPDVTAKRDCASEIEAKADTIAQQLTAKSQAPRFAHAD